MSKTTVLIVEDEGIVALDLAHKLEGLGYEIAGSAASGDEAVTLACRLRPDLVLMDISLEGPMDGIEATEAIRRQYDVPVVYLTAHSDPATLARAKLTGPFGYILKPFEQRDLATQIEMAIYRHQADRQLRQQRELLRVTLSSIGDAVIATDAAAQITFVNPVAEALTGWEFEEAAGQPVQCVFRIVNEQTGQPQEEPVARVLREGHAIELANHTALVTKDGRTVPIEDSAAPILDTSGKVIGAVLVFHDVTEKRRAEESLQTNVQRFYSSLSSMYGSILLVTNEGKVEFANQPFCDFFNVNASPQDLIGHTSDEIIGKIRLCYQHPERAVIRIREIVCRGEPVRGEEVALSDGRTCLRDFIPIEFEGKSYGRLWHHIDITPRKRAEDALRESERRLAGVLESMPDAFVSFDRELRYTYVNGNAERLQNAHHEDLLGRDVRAVYPDPESYKTISQIERVLHEQVPITVTSYHAGFDRWVEVRAFPTPDGVSVFYKDVSGMVKAEQSLRQSREDLDRAQEVGQIGWWRLDTRRNVLSWSDETYRIFGVPKETPLDYDTFVAFIHPDDRQYVNTQWNAALRGEPYDIEHRIVVHGQVKWVREKAYLEFDEAGRVRGGFGITQDITQRKNAEEALAAAKAAAEAANEAKSQFLANMSHELRTPMNAILGMIDVALPKAADPTVLDCLQTAKGSADLLLTLLNDLLDSGKIESGKLELESAPFSLRRVLDQITRVLAVRASEKGLTFYCRMPDETPDAIVGDRMRLQQVLLNLASNAIKFTERGSVEISLHARSHDGEASLEFAVRDTGIGIPPSSLERLFQPFSQADPSTTRRFGGTGLGLSISKGLVEMMGGRIWAESAVGRGSTFHFTVRLPLAQELPRDFEAPVVLPTAACGQLRVLLVEDNPANQKLAMYILQDRGHVVESASDGQTAICMTEQNRYDVILMDVQMPEMNGLEATAAIRKRESSGSRVPIIAITAHAMKSDRDRCLAAGMDGYLSKPVHAQEMIGLVEGLARGAVPVAQVAAATPIPTDASPPATAPVFDPELALKRCFNKPTVFCDMIRYFFEEVDGLFPQMRTALEKADLYEVGRLGHRLKGTVVYLGAESATKAAIRVEQFEWHGGELSEAEVAIDALEHECMVLKTALTEHSLAAGPKQDD